MSNATIYDKGFDIADKTRTISKLVITASASSSSSLSTSGSNYYHWRIYLLLSPFDISTSKSKSVLLDMYPANPPIATLWIASKPNEGSHSRSKIELDIFPSQKLTVGQLINFFIQKGMHRYTYDSNGTGCLFWTATGIHHLHEAKLIEAGAPEKLHAFHKTQARLHPERHPLPMRKGTFY